MKYPSTLNLNFPQFAVAPAETDFDFSSFNCGIPNNFAARLSFVKVPELEIAPSKNKLEVALKYN